MESRILVTKKDDRILTIKIEDDKIVSIQAESAESSGILGNVYVGKVSNVVKNINAAFVEFREGKMGYLSLKKYSDSIHTDGVPYQEGRVLIGDEIIVQVEGYVYEVKDIDDLLASEMGYPIMQESQMSFVQKFCGYTFLQSDKLRKCIVRGSRILMSDGSLKNIEDVKVGDFVASKEKNDNK